MTVSCITGGGLNSMDVSAMQFRSQVVLLWQMFAGNAVLLSLGPTVVRMAYFRRAASRFVASSSNDLTPQGVPLTALAELDYGKVFWGGSEGARSRKL